MCRQTCDAVLYAQHVSDEAKKKNKKKTQKWHDLNPSQQSLILLQAIQT